jgi:hypothetical protein
MCLVAGCGVPPGEEIETVQGKLSFGAWQTLGGKNFDENGPGLVTKQQGNGTSGATWWATVVAPDHKLWSNTNSGSFVGWSTLTTTTSPTAATASASWMGPSGVGASLNAAVAWIDNNGVKVGLSQTGFGALTNIVSLGGNTNRTPALAVANNVLFVFVKDNTTNQIKFKRCPVNTAGYNPANWSTSWTNIAAPTGGLGGGAFGNGPGAAAISSNQIMIMASGSDGGNTCIAANATVGTSSTSVGAWHVVFGCQIAEFSRPGMTAIGTGGISGGARIVLKYGGGLQTGTTTDGVNIDMTEVPPDSCTSYGADPQVTQHMWTGKMVIATTCNFSTSMSWRTLTP